MLRPAIRAGKQGIRFRESQETDGALDHVRVDLDPSIAEEQAQPGPAAQGIADRLGQLALLADRPKFIAQPRLQRLQYRAAARLPCGAALLGRAAADLGLDTVEPRDARQGLHGDRPLPVVEGPAHVAPLEGQVHHAPLRKRLVALVAVYLQHAPEAGQVRDRLLGRAVAGDDLDTGMATQLRSDGQSRAVGQQVDGASPLQVDDEGAVGPSLAEARRRCRSLAVGPPSAAGGDAGGAASYRGWSAFPGDRSDVHRPARLLQGRSGSGPERGGVSVGLVGVSAVAAARRRCGGGRWDGGSRSVGCVGAASRADRGSADRQDGDRSGCAPRDWACHRPDLAHGRSADGRG